MKNFLVGDLDFVNGRTESKVGAVVLIEQFHNRFQPTDCFAATHPNTVDGILQNVVT